MATGMDLPETMLLAEAVLIGLDNVTDGLVVYPARIRSRFLEELPFMITEAVSISILPRAGFPPQWRSSIQLILR